MIHHKRSDRGRQSNHFALIEQNGREGKCEQAWHSYEHNKAMHVPSHSEVNEVSAPSLLGIEPVS
jgi:hypothetical protein